MKKTNFTFLKGLAMAALMVLGLANANAQGLACQDHINASINDACSVSLATVVTASSGSTITVIGENNVPVAGPIFTMGTNLKVNKIYTYEISNGTNKCWGTIKFEDKLAPTMTCPDPTTVSCSGDYKFSTSEVLIGETNATTGVFGLNAAGLLLTTGTPSAIKECSSYKMYYSDAKTLGCTATSVGTVTRTFRITDQYGNTFACTQLLTIVGGNNVNSTFTLPANVTYTACKAAF